MQKELPKAYNPKEVEDKIYIAWEKSGFFNPDNLDLPKSAPSYTIVLPPPNITDKLHLGHASMLAIEDLLIRYHRMKGYRALWLPGTDHAAIATQNVVEKKLLKEEGLSRHDLGREKFLKKVWEHLEKTQAVILNQTKKMGASLDWSREAFTLDKQRKKAVKKMFVDMYEAGAIYRGERIVNWCPRCHSTLADDEVEYKNQKAKLYTFKYSKDFPFTIATTRPETKLGDTAVAVNPKDKRYKKYINKIYEVDFVGIKLKLKIIADRHVEMNFGTGALGVTPAHSMADWQIAEANNLKIIKVIGEDGKINNNFLEYSGKTVEKARAMIVEKLRKNNLLEKEEEIENNLSVCYRCRTPIEPLPSKQWFVNVDKKLKRLGGKSLKEKAIEVAKNKEIKFIPDRFEKRYLDWMENLHDWCVSRQIWFGHRIPVWYKKESRIKNQELRIKKGKIYVGVEAPKSDYQTAYVFSGDEKYGNVAAVIKNENDGNKMSKTAKEIGVPESVFVLPAESSNYDTRFRFFSKNGKETPLCGHALLAGAATFKKKNLKIKTNAGVVLTKKENEQIFFQVNNSKKINPDFIENLPAKFLGIEKNDFESLGIFSIGTPKLIFKVKDINTLKKIAPDFEKLKEWNKNKNFSGFCFFAINSSKKEIIFVRQFNPVLGINEDAATGVAAGALAGILNEDFIVKQGLENFENKIYIQRKDNKLWIGGNVILQKSNWVQDPDSLDTWFSSGMWTFSTLGWPNNFKNKKKTGDLKKFHPTQVLETGYEILTLWVSRMIMMSLFALQEIPFENVYLHGMVLDEHGKKMSKSKGNGIDPLDMIDKFGTDAVRLSLLIGSTPGNDLRLSEEKIAGFRNFTNKLWNISRYILQNQKLKIKNQEIDYKNLTLADKWIISELTSTTKTVEQHLLRYEFSIAGEELKDFTWNKFADWYIESTKFNDNIEKDKVLMVVLKDLLKLWHPFIPFVTEEIWKKFNDTDLIVENYPDSKKYNNEWVKFSEEGVTEKFKIIQNIIKSIRNARSKYKIETSRKIEAIIYADDKKILIEKQRHLIKGLQTGISELKILNKGTKIKDAIHLVVDDIEIYLIGVIDKKKEEKNLQKEISNLEKYLNQIKNKLGNKNFISNAPAEIIKIEKKKYRETKNRLKKLKDKLKLC